MRPFWILDLGEAYDILRLDRDGTVGKNAKRIGDYIRNQLQEDIVLKKHLTST